MIPALKTILFPVLASLLPMASSSSSWPELQLRSACSAATVGSAIYVMSNEDINTIIALPIASDGRISIGTVTATGGAGGVGRGANGQPVGGDALFSQSAVTVAGGALFAVNAGTNTLSMFSIDETNPTFLSLIGRPVLIPGDFPNTVAVSLKHKLACVATTGNRSGVSCANFSLSKGLSAMDSLRAFGLGQSTPPVGPANTVSQALFSNDEMVLNVMVKGDPASATNNIGYVASFGVEEASCGRNANGDRKPARLLNLNRNAVNGTKLLFGSVVIPDSNERILVTDPSFGAAILNPKRPSFAFELGAKTTIPGQKATCWAAISPATGTAFVTDGGVNRLVELTLNNGQIDSILDLSTTGAPGLLDIAAAGNYLYALSPGDGVNIKPSVTVVDVSGGRRTAKLHQHLTLGGLAGNRVMGMAVQLD